MSIHENKISYHLFRAWQIDYVSWLVIAEENPLLDDDSLAKYREHTQEKLGYNVERKLGLWLLLDLGIDPTNIPREALTDVLPVGAFNMTYEQVIKELKEEFKM